MTILYIKEERVRFTNEKVTVLKCGDAWIAEVKIVEHKEDEVIAFEIVEWMSESSILLKELVEIL